MSEMKFQMPQVARLTLCTGMLWLTIAVTDSLRDTHAAGGSLTVAVREEADESPVITRMVVQRADAPGRRVTVRKTVPVGGGVGLDM